MASLPILTRDERNGSVFVEDRREDGAIVVLRCAESSIGGGVAARSGKPGTTVWPMLRRLGRGRALNKILGSDFVLTVDTSDLPPGRLEFDLGRFVECVQRAVDSGQSVVHLDEGHAREWGLRSERQVLG